MQTEQLDCIVRFHDIQRLGELERCVFSLIGQRYRPLNLIIVTQRFADAELRALETRLAPLCAHRDAPSLEIVNFEQPAPVDARTELLNMGLAHCRGRYVAFLDYDDTLYPEAYELLVSQLELSRSAIAFASVRVIKADVFAEFIRPAAETPPPFSGGDLVDLFSSNFCPIHSYVIDRADIPSDVLLFDTGLIWEEDYDLLLRVCAAHPSDFSLLTTRVGDYYYKNDGSNTVPTEGGVSEKRAAEYERVRRIIEDRRRSTPVAPRVLESLGISPTETLTVRDVLNRFARKGKRNQTSATHALGVGPFLYRLLPSHLRPRLKHFAFRHFPGLFAATASYRAWAAIHNRPSQAAK